MSKARDLADSAQEINILDGKSFLDEDNLASDSATGIASQQSIKAYVDGITTTNITSTGALNSGSITSGFGNIDNGSSTITTTGAISGGSFVIGSADINESDLESIDGITAGTVSASKAVVVNTNKDITGFRNITATGTISGSLSGTLSGSLSSTTTATTQAESDDSTKIATTAYVTDKITTLIGGAPSTLNDLNELAAAINDDANYNSTLTTALATKLPLAGGTLTGNVTFGDNNKAIFGAGSDLQIYSDGTHGIIKESGSGDLLIYGNNLRLGNADGSELYILGNNNAEVQLRYDNATKLATTSTGIDVTGTALNLDGGGSNPLLTLKNSATYYSTVSHDTFNVQNNGLKLSTQGTERMRIDSSGRVGIGTSSPNYTLEVYKSSVGNVASFNSSSGNRRLDITSTDNGAYLGAEWYRNINSAGGIHTWSVNGTEKLRIDSSGNVLVGTTTYNGPVNASSGDYGAAIWEGGLITAGTNASETLALNRMGSNGDIAVFKRSGSTKGSIGVSNDGASFGNATQHIAMHSGKLFPASPTHSSLDNTIDLGYSAGRFKNVHAVNYYGSGANLTGIVAGRTYGTTATTTSGTSFTFTGIPAGVYEVNLLLNGVRVDGGYGFFLRLGTSSGIVSSGYQNQGQQTIHYDNDALPNVASDFDTGFSGLNDTAQVTGYMKLTRSTSSSNTWIYNAHYTGDSFTSTSYSNNHTFLAGGAITLGGELTQIQIVRERVGKYFTHGSATITWSQ